MNCLYKLSSLKEGCHCTAEKLLTDSIMGKRLRDIGLVEGTQIHCLRKSISGDPVAYRIRGAVIALRSDDTSKIIVSGNSDSFVRDSVPDTPASLLKKA